MSSEKQIEANKNNALLSTGPISEEGKKTICLNAIKHGIFAKDLIIESGIGKEKKEEYDDLLKNLIDSLNPNNQMEMLLVEKISIDFWRLRRVIRFESGCVKKFIQDTLRKYYTSYENKSNQKIDDGIEQKKSAIEWNTQYIKCLEKGLVTFDQPVWKGKDIESDIIADFYEIARTIDYEKKSKEEREQLYNWEYGFDEIKNFINKHGYLCEKKISLSLIELYSKQNKSLNTEIQELERKKEENQASDDLNVKLCAIPENESIDKIMKYETSIQRSIYQNLLLLNKLQQAV